MTVVHAHSDGVPSISRLQECSGSFIYGSPRLYTYTEDSGGLGAFVVFQDITLSSIQARFDSGIDESH